MCLVCLGSGCTMRYSINLRVIRLAAPESAGSATLSYNEQIYLDLNYMNSIIMSPPSFIPNRAPHPHLRD